MKPLWKVTFIVHDAAVGKMEKQLHLWIHEMTSNKKSIVDSIVVRLKAKEMCTHLTQGQDNAKPFWASAGWRAQFKKWCHMKNVRLAGKPGSTDQEAAEEFRKYLPSVKY